MKQSKTHQNLKNEKLIMSTRATKLRGLFAEESFLNDFKKELIK